MKSRPHLDVLLTWVCTYIMHSLVNTTAGRGFDSGRLGAIGYPRESRHSLQLPDAQEPTIFFVVSTLRQAPRATERRPRVLLYGGASKRGHSGDSIPLGEIFIDKRSATEHRAVAAAVTTTIARRRYQSVPSRPRKAQGYGAPTHPTTHAMLPHLKNCFAFELLSILVWYQVSYPTFLFLRIYYCCIRYDILRTFVVGAVRVLMDVSLL